MKRRSRAAARLTHVDEAGRLRMVDVSDKAVTVREAVARGRITMSADALRAVREATLKKGDALQAARLAGIMAAKRTAELIPLCHQIPLTSVTVEVAADEAHSALVVTARAKTNAETGVEMEAMNAAAIACLTIYDMLKASDRAMVIESIMLLEKHGGASGDYVRKR